MKTCLSRLLVIILSLTLLIGIGLAAYLIWFNTAPLPPTPLGIEFRSVEAGDIVTVSANVRGDQVSRAELWVEDQRVAFEANPNPALAGDWTVAWQWTPPAPGVYPLAARAFDQAGHYAGTAPFEVVVPPHLRLVFASNRGGRYGLYSLAIATRETMPQSPSTGDERQPGVSSLQVLAFASNRSGAWHIWTRPLSGGNAVDLTPDVPAAQGPAWAPDGQRLAFELVNSNVTNIFVSDAHGQNRVQVTNGDTYDGQVSFAPNGRQIAFASKRGGQWDIYEVDLDGQNLARLTNDTAQDWQPAWSPDGGRIAFASTRSGISQIYMMAASGNGDPIQVTNLPAGAEFPAWSPDGNWLAYVGYSGDAEGTNRRELYLLYAPANKPLVPGSGLIRLTQNAFDDTEPAWVSP
ncbi:MAG: hypothetical protein WCF84_12085 [Anaerolineae bacterium]